MTERFNLFQKALSDLSRFFLFLCETETNGALSGKIPGDNAIHSI